jgi:hypothetical protein
MKPKLPTIQELSSLVRDLKKTIRDDYRSTCADPDDTAPSMDVTIGWSPDSGAWDYQTGDNSFFGGAYLHPVWAVATIDRRSNSRDIARELIAQLDEQTWE